MLPGVGGFELVIIAIVALVVVGPKDLPVLMRKVGAFINRMRGMAAEFRASFDEMARQSELDELRKQVEELRSGRLADPITKEIQPTIAEIESDLRGGPTGWMGDVDTPAEEPDRPAPEPAPAARPRKKAAAAKPPAKASAKAPAKAKAAPKKANPAGKPPAKPRARPAAARKGAAS